MIKDKYTVDELRAACDSPESRKRIESVSNLTLGEYLRLLENPDNWDKLELHVSREMFIERLDEIRQIRNDVMHFDPDGITSGKRSINYGISFFLCKVSLGRGRCRYPRA